MLHSYMKAYNRFPAALILSIWALGGMSEQGSWKSRKRTTKEHILFLKEHDQGKQREQEGREKQEEQEMKDERRKKQEGQEMKGEREKKTPGGAVDAGGARVATLILGGYGGAGDAGGLGGKEED